MSESRYSNTSFNNKQRRTTPTVKNIFAGTIYGVSGDINSTYILTASSQDIALAPSGLFLEQGGLSQDGMFSPFQIGTNSTGLPVMPTGASTNCVPSQSNIVDPPVNEWSPPTVNISYLNPFKRPSDPSHGSGSHYDGNIVFNGGTSDGQNLVSEVYLRNGSFPDNLRPVAMRGPIVIQGWGYDLNGKPIPNKIDNAANARIGSFQSANLEDEFLDNWIQKRETWPVAPLDVRYDRQRKVWTVPNTFRIIKATATGDILVGDSGGANATNMNTVYDSSGAVVGSPTITVENPFGPDIEAGDQFFAFYDTKDCVYYPILTGGDGGGCINISRISGCGHDFPDDSGDYGKIKISHGLKGTVPAFPDPDCKNNAFTISTIHRFGGNVFANIAVRSGLQLTQTDSQTGTCNYTLDAIPASDKCNYRSGIDVISFVSDVCCVGSGLDIKYGSLTFVSGCFSGYTHSGCT